MKHLELTDIELGQIIEAVTVRCTETHRAAPNYSNELFDILVKLQAATSCPAPVLVPSSDKGGAPSLLFTEIHVDPDVPFCEFCELAQLDLDVSYSCQCKEVF